MSAVMRRVRSKLIWPPQCKKESHERNAARLESEKTQVVKGV